MVTQHKEIKGTHERFPLKMNAICAGNIRTKPYSILSSSVLPFCHVCMCVCVYVCMCVCVYVCMCVYVCVCIYMICMYT